MSDRISQLQDHLNQVRFAFEWLAEKENGFSWDSSDAACAIPMSSFWSTVFSFLCSMLSWFQKQDKRQLVFRLNFVVGGTNVQRNRDLTTERVTIDAAWNVGAALVHRQARNRLRYSSARSGFLFNYPFLISYREIWPELWFKDGSLL